MQHFSPDSLKYSKSALQNLSMATVKTVVIGNICTAMINLSCLFSTTESLAYKKRNVSRQCQKAHMLVTQKFE